MAASWLALTVATFTRSPLPAHFLALSVMALQATSAASLMPRCTATALAPVAMKRRPPLKMAAASTVAAVVPSPATSAVFLATCWTMRAPMLANGSVSSTSLATVTPSLVTWGLPQLLAITTLRPVGPMVTATAWAIASTPFLSSACAAGVNFICLLLPMCGLPSFGVRWCGAGAAQES